MPPRKSNASVLSAGGSDDATLVDEQAGGVPKGGKTKDKEKEKGKSKGDDDDVAIEDLSMPRSIVQRLSRGVLPPNTTIQKDPLTAMTKGATVFINHIAQFANERTLDANRRTMQPDDVFGALKDAEFTAFIPRLREELKIFQDAQTVKRNEYRNRRKDVPGVAVDGGDTAVANAAAAAAPVEESAAGAAPKANGSRAVAVDGDEHPAKRVKLDEDVSAVAGSGANGKEDVKGEDVAQADGDGDEDDLPGPDAEAGSDEDEEEEEEEEDDEEDDDDDDASDEEFEESVRKPNWDVEQAESDAEMDKASESGEDMSE